MWCAVIPKPIFKPTADIDLCFSFFLDVHLIAKKSWGVEGVLVHKVGDQVGLA